ncbi:hypothetical protein EVA_04309 [gut metagenome]|uniref:Uncharacterized protein n=1 Tax=gut metagenome TaxID=749906 RepID=J9GJY2_9ZZZZ
MSCPQQHFRREGMCQPNFSLFPSRLPNHGLLHNSAPVLQSYF